MALDIATISLAGGLVTFFSGVFLVLYWAQNREAEASLWWALGNCGLGAGIMLVGFYASLPFVLTKVLGSMLPDLSAPFPLIAAIVLKNGSLDRRRVGVLFAALVLFRLSTPAFVALSIHAAIGAAVAGSLYAAAAYVFWLGRNEVLRGRMPLVVIVAVYGSALFLLSVQFALQADFVPVAAQGWLGAIQIVGLVYALGAALFLTMMLNNRREKAYLAQASTDPLTGLPNRRAFIGGAQRLLDRQSRDGGVIGLLAFDLDRFKRINDTHGHAMGDRILCVFAEVLSATLRPMEIAARIGGEEFVAVTPGTDSVAAVAIANRIREAFAKAGQFVDGHRIGATVSVGVTTSTASAGTIVELLADADAALYRAKDQGRNRVVLAEPDPAGPDLGGRNRGGRNPGPPSNVVRIAG